ncbi:MAG: thioredoxin family protein [Candidatus Coprovivens sp.]
MLKKLTNDDDFYKIIEEGTWLVDFSATWCGPCRMLEPVLEEFSKDNQVLQVDIDQFSELTSSFDIMSVPTLIVFKDGNKVVQDVGYRSLDQLNELVK